MFRGMQFAPLRLPLHESLWKPYGNCHGKTTKFLFLCASQERKNWIWKDLSKNTVLELNCVKISPFFPFHFQWKAGGETLQYTEKSSSHSSVSFKKLWKDRKKVDSEVLLYFFFHFGRRKVFVCMGDLLLRKLVPDFFSSFRNIIPTHLHFPDVSKLL